MTSGSKLQGIAADLCKDAGLEHEVTATRTRVAFAQPVVLVSEIKLWHRQWIDAVLALLVHPIGLGAIPVRQQAATEHARRRVLVDAGGDGCEKIWVDALVIVHDGGPAGLQRTNGAVECRRLSGRGFGDPLQRDVFLRWVVFEAIEQSVGVIRTGVGDDEKPDPRHLFGLVECPEGAPQQGGAIVGTDDNGQWQLHGRPTESGEASDRGAEWRPAILPPGRPQSACPKGSPCV